MKKLVSVLVGLLLIGSAQATEVAVVDFRAALLQSNIGQEAAKAPKQKVADMDARLKEEQATLQQLAEELKRDELTLSEEEFKKRRQGLAQRQQQIQVLAAKMQNEAKSIEQQLIKSLTPKGELALKAIIEEKKLDLVLNRQLSLYANQGVDITGELVKRINKDN
ncbi:OmpH family outer membrane protein [Marinomonas sp. C2222]|uniref:OmpH family outer membrane protein n=1 Tax=Marinomonas sargassi TaxID=2984494 RepID=A0ABT2YV92_9GAMM|nr:OmpH family outer membrane protein [Marinomonas sargassi]MCV2403806.1 OmpH family outer membrane protein [Marinomonas sargassi]